ncbi:MAG: hypothetical protein IJ026_02055 [Candidatus Methanomethylophilaceae archaeon]|nr:hypothetical protein [Candidatus Methanomethylophilaceae archaeon]
MFKFKKGDRIPIRDGGDAIVIGEKPLGSGGQGEVYRVEYLGDEYALKWYTSPSIRENRTEFSGNIQENIVRGPPKDGFLWPKHLTEEMDGGFGYLMDLIPSNYSSFSDILRTYRVRTVSDGTAVRDRVGFTRLDVMVLSALRMVSSFRALQLSGVSYQDLNDGGFYIDTDTGDVLICDCDNVAPQGSNFGIRGKPGYMAPEVVTGHSKPCRDTDKHSLAVVLFKLLMRGDPLEGSAVCSCVVLTGSNELKHYGTDPVFVFDPTNTSNRPVKGVHSNVIKNWGLYPGYVREVFTRAFTDGLHDPSSRPIPNTWFKMLSRLRCDVVACGCGRQSFMSVMDTGSGNYRCPGCGREHMVMVIGGCPMVLAEGKEIHHCDVFPHSEDFETVVGRVVENKKVSGLLGIKNTSDRPWTAVLSDGTTKTVPIGGGVPIADGITIRFGTTENNFNSIPEGIIRR